MWTNNEYSQGETVWMRKRAFTNKFSVFAYETLKNHKKRCQNCTIIRRILRRISVRIKNEQNSQYAPEINIKYKFLKAYPFTEIFTKETRKKTKFTHSFDADVKIIL